MSIQISANSFLPMLRQSRLLSSEQLIHVERQFSPSGRTVTADAICDWLRTEGIITDWQAEKLQQLRYRGFFLGPYKLLRRVARGGMSTIYAAEHLHTGEVHALKVLPPAKSGQASYLPRFQREAAMTQRLSHPHIIRVFGLFAESDGQDEIHFIAMELLEGRDLFELVNSDGPLPCRIAAEYIRQAATGLSYAHESGLVHRDIKPGNLFLSEQSIRILDLGLAQDFDSEENLTREFNEKVLGTADYLAPEQAADSHSVDGRADLYSLGCSLYFLLTGRPPFTEGTLVQRLVAHQTKTPPPVSQFRDDVPEELNAILAGMMARHRDQRTAAAAIVAEQLATFLKQKELAVPLRTISETSPEKECSTSVSVVEEDNGASAASLSPSETNTFCHDDSSPHTLRQAMEGSQETALSNPHLAFTDLLNTIEKVCRPGGLLASAFGSAELLEVAAKLQKGSSARPVPNESAAVGAESSAPDVLLEDEALPLIVPHSVLRSAPRTRRQAEPFPLRAIWMLTVVLLLISVAAALIDLAT